MHSESRQPDAAARPKIAAAEAEQLVERIMRSRPPGETLNVQQILDEHPELRAHRDCVLDLLYDDMCRRREAEPKFSVSIYAGHHPEYRQSICRLAEADQFFRENTGLLGEVSEEDWPTPGSIVNEEFQILERIGRGAFSRVYLARQMSVAGRRVVVKVCLRGREETDALGRLNHPAIADVHTRQELPGTPLCAICMPAISRVTLENMADAFAILPPESGSPDRSQVLAVLSRINNSESGFPSPAKQSEGESAEPGVLPKDRNAEGIQDSAEQGRSGSEAADLRRQKFGELIAAWGTQLSEGLQHAHDNGVLHCDMKPANVLVDNSAHLKILDFNLAASATPDDSGLEGGTVPFMATEQLLRLLGNKSGGEDSGAQQGKQSISGESAGSDSSDSEVTQEIPKISPATDVFGICATLWTVVTGVPPFGPAVDEHSRRAGIQAQLNAHHQGLSQEQLDVARELIPSDLVDLLVSGLAPDPALRPPTAADLAAGFRRLHTRYCPEVADSAVRPGRRRILLAVAALAAVTAVGGAFLLRPFLFDPPGGLPKTLVELQSDWQAAPDDPDAAADYSERLIRDHRFTEAESVLNRPTLRTSADQRLRFLRLLSETGSLTEPLVTEDEPGEEWDHVLASWQQLAAEGVYPIASGFNLAWCQLLTRKRAEAEATLAKLPVDAAPATLRRIRRMLLCYDLTSNDDSSQFLSQSELQEMRGMIDTRIFGCEVAAYVHAAACRVWPEEDAPAVRRDVLYLLRKTNGRSFRRIDYMRIMNTVLFLPKVEEVRELIAQRTSTSEAPATPVGPLLLLPDLEPVEADSLKPAAPPENHSAVETLVSRTAK